VSSLEVQEERRRLDLTTTILTEICGKRPAGWFSLPRQQDRYAGGQISPNTIQLLIDGGYEYLGNGMADDIPHYGVVDIHTKRHILTLPYYYHFDDLFSHVSGLKWAVDLRMLRRSSKTRDRSSKLRIGGDVSLWLYPISSHRHCIEMFERFLLHIKGFLAMEPKGANVP
jgi:hypothetical protein